jgi:uncharacterized protein with gpF-like domain
MVKQKKKEKQKEKKVKTPIPNAALMIAYKKRLQNLIAQMNQQSSKKMIEAIKKKSFAEEVKENKLFLIDDKNLKLIITENQKKWEKKFDHYAWIFALFFSANALARFDYSFKSVLKTENVKPEFKKTPAITEALDNIVKANVALIKSIPAKHFEEIEKTIIDHLMDGGDISELGQIFQSRYEITQYRAELIAKDQTSKAHAMLLQIRQQELGIKEAIWRHSHASVTPRPSHLAADGKRYKVSQGMYLDGKWTYPGYEINCKCFSYSILPGLD